MRYCLTTAALRPTSPIAIGLVEEGIDIFRNRLFQRGEAAVVAGAAQIFDAGLGEILILVADRRRHVDIFDVRRAAERGEHGNDQITKAARRSGADVEYARHG